MTILLLLTLAFQSTLLVRGATHKHTLRGIKEDISIHAPRERSDILRLFLSNNLAISIHAPRERSDGKVIHTIQNH